MHNHGIPLLDFPPYSPDLNPIENLWSDLKRRIEMHNSSTVEELAAALALEWELTSQERFVTLAKSMTRRCKAVVEKQGYMTKY